MSRRRVGRINAVQGVVVDDGMMTEAALDDGQQADVSLSVALGDDVGSERHALTRRPLGRIELDLLDAVWSPVSRKTSGWPVWDYMSRTLYRSDAAVIDADAVRIRLPTIQRMVPGPQTPTYGLMWVRDHERYPRPETPVGLTFAGMRLVTTAHYHPPLRRPRNVPQTGTFGDPSDGTAA